MRKSSLTVLWSIDKGPRWHQWDRRRHLLSSWSLKKMPVLKCLHRWSDSILRLKCLVYFTSSYPQPFSIFGKKLDWNRLILFAAANSDQNITTACFSELLNEVIFVIKEIKNYPKRCFIGVWFPGVSTCLQLFSSSVVRIQLSHNILTIYPIYPISKS